VPPIQQIPRSPEIVQQVRRRLKAVTSLHMANACLNYHKLTDEIAEGFACSYSLNPQERFNVRCEMRKMRLGQKALVLGMRAKFPLNCRSEDRRQQFSDWFYAESRRIAARHSDSDDNRADLGLEAL